MIPGLDTCRQATKKRVWAVLVLLISLLTACAPNPAPATVSANTTPEAKAPAYEAAAAFLNAWKTSDYEAMYALCSTRTRTAVPYQEFQRIYQDIAREATILAVRPTLRAVLQEGLQTRAAFAVEIETSLVGTFSVENELFLLWDRDRWAVDWSTQTIFRELEGDSLVHMISRPPVRANIYDVNGRGLAIAGDSVTVGIVPDEIDDEPAVLARLSQVLDIPQKEIKASYESQPPSWFIPIADISVEASREHYESLSTEPGILLREKRTRVYREPATAPHIVGFLGKVPVEELVEWQQRGYTGDELVGRAGIEAWGEPYLAGRRGAVLTVITPEGQVVATLARREAVPARSIYLTLDSVFQRTVEELLGERKGAVVVMDVNDGRILALATWPRFDPNLFAQGIDPDVWTALANDPANPLLNRALQGAVSSRLDLQDRDDGHDHGARRSKAYADVQLPRLLGQTGLAHDLLAQERPRHHRSDHRAGSLL